MQRTEQKHRLLLSRLPASRRDGARRLLDDSVLRRLGRERIESLIRQCGFPFAFSDRGDARRDLEAISFLLLLQSGEGEPVRWDHPRRHAIRDAAEERLKVTETIFGPRRGKPRTRIMVTLPSDAVDPRVGLPAWHAAGMDAVRINCARDNAVMWKALIDTVRRQAGKRSCPVFMDLAGSKLRTGSIPDEPPVIKIRPERNRLGSLLRPARIRFVPAASPTGGEKGIPVEGTLLPNFAVGTRLRFRDARGLHRSMRVLDSSPSQLMCECRRTAYLVPGSVVSAAKEGKSKRRASSFRIAPFPGEEGGLRLSEGARFLLIPHPAPARPRMDRLPSLCLSTTINPSLLAVGSKVVFDDGKIEGKVAAVDATGLEIEITVAAGGIRMLRGDRGVSFPGVDLGLPPMTRKDRKDLRFAARYADMIALSFIRRGKDLGLLRKALRAHRASTLPIVVKIENAHAMESLDEILLDALRYAPAAVLIARGDLAMECGFTLLPQLQREILRRSHLAGLPVIWATGVLENLSRKGIPTRSELTDADVAGDADCVLLNKGAYVADSVALLDRLYGERARSKFTTLRPAQSKETRHAS
jgi:pyruvate kinase